MEFFGVSIFDLVVLGVFSLSALIGLATGFVRPAFFIVAWLVAALASLFFYPYTESVAAGLFSQEWVVKISAGLVPFLIVLAILSIVGQVFSQKIQKSGLSNVDKALGALAGAIAGTGILGVAYLGLDSYYGEQPRPDWIESAVSQPYIAQAAAIAQTLIPYDALNDPGDTLSDISRAVDDAAGELTNQRSDIGSGAPIAPTGNRLEFDQ